MDPTILSNYCPISNIMFLSKVVERVVAEQLQVFLDAAEILDPFQSIFFPCHGTETTLIALTNDPQRNLD